MSRLIAVLIVCAVSAAAVAGPYTSATRADQLCTDYGRMLGSNAFKAQLLYRDDRARMAEAEEALAAAERGTDEAEKVSARTMLKMERRLQAGSAESLAKRKAFYAKFV